MIKRLPAPMRHALLGVLAVVLGWGATEIVPALQGEIGWADALTLLFGAVLAYATPLVTAYGVGSGDV